MKMTAQMIASTIRIVSSMGLLWVEETGDVLPKKINAAAPAPNGVEGAGRLGRLRVPLASCQAKLRGRAVYELLCGCLDQFLAHQEEGVIVAVNDVGLLNAALIENGHLADPERPAAPADEDRVAALPGHHFTGLQTAQVQVGACLRTGRCAGLGSGSGVPTLIPASSASKTSPSPQAAISRCRTSVIQAFRGTIPRRWSTLVSSATSSRRLICLVAIVTTVAHGTCREAAQISSEAGTPAESRGEVNLCTTHTKN